MTNMNLLQAMGRIDPRLIADAAPDVSRKESIDKLRMKWGIIAACLCLVITGGLVFNSLNPVSFNFIAANFNNAAIMTSIPVGDRTAVYQKVNISEDKLKKYVGNEYLETDTIIWYLPKKTDNLKYLIHKGADNSFTLWTFKYFKMREDETYSYGDVLSVIYGVDSADDIVSIKTSPFKWNSTPEGIAIQRKVGTHRYTDREAISKFYNIIKDMICYDADRKENPADDTRFSYSFSTEDGDNSTYGVRCISVKFTNGIVLDSLKYDALSGSFFEYGGIFTEPLEENDVYALNNIFNIK